MTDSGPQQTFLSVRNLTKEFPVTRGLLRHQVGTIKAVSDVSFDVRSGETFGLVGESGCGKTTIGRCCVALERPDSGELWIDGTDIAQLSADELRPRRRDMQLVYQDPYSSLDPRMNVESILHEPLAIQRLGTRAEQRDRVAELLEEVGLKSDSLRRYPHEFSGGQRQRLGIARALALNPKLIVADEPVSALDVSIRAQILNLMNRLQARHGITYVIISHDLSVVRYVADRIGVMYLGKLVEIGTCAEVYRRPVHPYTAGLLASVPVPDPARAGEEKAVPPPSGELPSAITPPSGCRFRTRCYRAQEACALAEPPLRRFGADHQAACHFPLCDPSD